MRAWRNTHILNSINQKLPLTVRSNIIIQFVSALYPPQLWAWEPHADEHDVSTTTNAAEAFLKHMKDLFNSPRPNLYLLAFKLLQLQKETYVNLQSLHVSLMDGICRTYGFQTPAN